MQKYTVQKGDSLWKISGKFGVQVTELASVNGLHTYEEQNIIHPGQVLVIPEYGKKYDTQLTIEVRNLRWGVYPDAHLRLTFDGNTHNYITDKDGLVKGILIDDSTKGVKVELNQFDGRGYFIIANHLQIPLGKYRFRISSREMIVHGNTSTEKGPSVSTKTNEKKKVENKTQKGDSEVNGHKDNPKESKPSSNGNDAGNSKMPSSEEVDGSQNTKVEGKTADNKQNKPPVPSADDGKTSGQNSTRAEGGTPVLVNPTGNHEKGLHLPPEGEPYRALILETSEKYGMEAEGIAAFIEAESGWNPSVGNKKAVGLGQFTPTSWIQGSTYERSKLFQFIQGSRAKVSNESILELRKKPEYAIDMIGAQYEHTMKMLSSRISPMPSLSEDEKIKLMYFYYSGEARAWDIMMDGKDNDIYNSTFDSSDSLYMRVLGMQGLDEEILSGYKSIDHKGKTAFTAWILNRTDTVIIPEHFRLEPKDRLGKTISLGSIIKKFNPNFDPEYYSLSEKPQRENKDLDKQDNVNSNDGVTWHNPLLISKIRKNRFLNPKGSYQASFGYVRNNGHRAHQGVDIEAKPTTAIYTVCKCIFVYYMYQKGYGNCLCISVDVNDLPLEKQKLCFYRGNEKRLDTIYFFYAHLENQAGFIREYMNNKKGKLLHIKAGEIIGYTGFTGNAGTCHPPMNSIENGSHLHFEVRTRYRITSNERKDDGLIYCMNPAPFIDGFDHD